MPLGRLWDCKLTGKMQALIAKQYRWLGNLTQKHQANNNIHVVVGEK